MYCCRRTDADRGKITATDSADTSHCADVDGFMIDTQTTNYDLINQ